MISARTDSAVSSGLPSTPSRLTPSTVISHRAFDGRAGPEALTPNERHVADTFFPPQSSSAWSSMVSPPRRSVAKCRLVLEVLGVGSRMPSTGHGTSRPGDVRSRDRPADGRGRRGDDEGLLRNQLGSDQTLRAWQAAGCA